MRTAARLCVSDQQLVPGLLFVAAVVVGLDLVSSLPRVRLGLFVRKLGGDFMAVECNPREEEAAGRPRAESEILVVAHLHLRIVDGCVVAVLLQRLNPRVVVRRIAMRVRLHRRRHVQERDAFLKRRVSCEIITGYASQHMRARESECLPAAAALTKQNSVVPRLTCFRTQVVVVSSELPARLRPGR